jgi:Mg-chelatase subunit ChlD
VLIELLLLLATTPQPSRPAAHLVLLIDISGSTTLGFVKRDHQLVPEAARALASALGPEDAARIGTFGDRINLDATEAVGGDAILAAAVSHDEPIGGPSPLWDALDAAAKALQSAARPKGIVVVTDGRSSANRVGFTEMSDRIARAGIPVFVVALVRDPDASPDPQQKLRELARNTDGTFQPVSRRQVAGAVSRAAATLRASATAR